MRTSGASVHASVAKKGYQCGPPRSCFPRDLLVSRAQLGHEQAPANTPCQIRKPTRVPQKQFTALHCIARNAGGRGGNIFDTLTDQTQPYSLGHPMTQRLIEKKPCKIKQRGKNIRDGTKDAPPPEPKRGSSPASTAPPKPHPGTTSPLR